MGRKIKLLLVGGVFCVSSSVGVASADSYTEAMESAAAALESARATLVTVIADFEAREAAAAARAAAAAEAEAARVAAEAERLRAAADSAAAAKRGKGVRAAAVDTAAAKKDKAVGVVPAVVDTAARKAVVIDSARVDTAAALAKGVDSAAVDTAVAKVVGVDSAAVVDTAAAAKVAGVDSAVVADSAAAKVAAADSAAVKPVVPKVVRVERPRKIYPIVKPEIEMVLVKGGRFMMGCVEERDNCMLDERPRHEVRLKDYYIGKYPVTQKQWWSVMGVNPAHREGEDLPVEQVSWDDVQEFIRRLNVLTGKKYRLPTEAEWEYAARGGAQSTGRRFSGREYLDDVAWYDYNSFGSTQPVGTKAPNELGVHDMVGNVWEWVGDYYDRYYYRESPLKNPRGPKYGGERVSRGCSFNSAEGHCRESLRNYHKPGSRTIYLGFRLAH